MYEINKILQQLGMNFKEFSEHYEIPYNTVRQWATGKRTPPSYVIKLLNEKIERDKKGEQLKIKESIYDEETVAKIWQFLENSYYIQDRYKYFLRKDFINMFDLKE